MYKLDTAAGEGGFHGGLALTKLPATKYRDAQLMGFKATKVNIVPKAKTAISPTWLFTKM